MGDAGTLLRALLMACDCPPELIEPVVDRLGPCEVPPTPWEILADVRAAIAEEIAAA